MAGPRKRKATADGGKPAVDLGLAAFLKAEEAIDLNVYLKRLIAERAEWRKSREEIESTGAMQYHRLASAGRWNEIIAACEREIAKAQNGIPGRNTPGRETAHAQLWWVKAQLSVKSMPVLMLAAPLESVCQAVKEAREKTGTAGGKPEAFLDDTEQQLFIEVLVEVARALQKSAEGALSIKFLESAYRQDPAHRRELSDLVEQELSSARERLRRRKSKRLISWLEELEALQGELRDIAAADESGLQSSSPLPLVAALDQKSRNKVVQSLVRSRSGSLALAALLALCMAGMVHYSFFVQKDGFLGAELVEVSTELADLGTAVRAVPLLPLPDQESRFDASRVGMVWDDFREQLEKGTKGPAAQSSGSQDSVKRAGKIITGGLSVDGPAEPPEVAALRNNHRPEKPAGEHQMTFSSAGEPLFRGETRGDTIVEGYPQGQIKTPQAAAEIRDCKIIAQTWVRDRPSEGGKGLQEVKPSQLVRVIERMGSWHKIQGRRKNEGYVRADATDCP